MSNRDLTKHAPRALFMGMQGNFSSPPLSALLNDGIDVCAVVLPARENDPQQSAARLLEPPLQARSLLPVINSSLHTSIARIAWERQIPVWEMSRMSDPQTIDLFSQYRPDVICVACFSLYIPRVILEIPRLGCLNVHPSLLPANRGPDPLFWTFHEGSRETGVTIHMLDEGLDSGPIVAQEKVEAPDGIGYVQLEAQCAALGGRLLARSTWQLFQGTAVLTAQDEAQSSYLPMPTDNDFVVPASRWEARRMYNFIRGVASRGDRVTVVFDDQTIQTTGAITYSHKDISGMSDKGMCVRCMDGWVVLRGGDQNN